MTTKLQDNAASHLRNVLQDLVFEMGEAQAIGLDVAVIKTETIASLSARIRSALEEIEGKRRSHVIDNDEAPKFVTFLRNRGATEIAAQHGGKNATEFSWKDSGIIFPAAADCVCGNGALGVHATNCPCHPGNLVRKIDVSDYPQSEEARS